jgi:ATP-dependent helicase/nuclease subunit B
MDPFVSQLADLCISQRTRAKWVLVPNHAIGRTLGDRLVLEGTSWANLRFVTPLDIALRMGAPFLVSRGIDPSAQGLGPALMMRLLLDLPEEGGYFRPLADQPTMAEALWSMICELRLAGIRAKQLDAAAFESAAKHAELRALLEAYENFLAKNKRGDIATVYEEALEHQDWCPIQPADCWTELPNAAWSPLQQKLIDALPGERILPRAIALPSATLPRRFAAGNVDLIAPDPNISPLAFLQAPGQANAMPGLQLFHAGGRDAEVEEVFRRVLASRRSLDEIEIACGDPGIAALAWEKACRYDWPVTIGPGFPAALTHPGRALLGFCSWIESDFTAGVMRRLLESGDISLASVDGITPGQAARLLVKSQAGWGRATYEISLNRLLGRYQRIANDKDRSEEQRIAGTEKAARIEQLLAWITKLLAAVPAAGQDNLVGLSETTEAALAFIETCAVKASALDAAAQIALLDAIRELRELGVFRCTLAIALSFIRDCVNGINVGRDRPRPGHLHVSLLAQAGYANRPLLFITGLEEGRVFPAAIEDPVLLDAERQKINPFLRRSSDRIEEAVYAVLSRFATAGSALGAEVCFSYSCRDLREYRETYPSWLMLQAYRLQTGDPSKSYPDLKAALGVPKSCVPETARAALSDSGWWLNGLKLAGSTGMADVLRQFPSLAQGRRAEEARQSPMFGEYDGFVPEAGKVLDPCAREQLVSPTQLENAAKCPFRHFLSRGLGLEAVDEGERDADVWLDPMLRGSELHDLYAAMLGKCRDEKRKPSFETHWPWLQERTHQRLNALRKEMPPPSEDVFEREVQDFVADVELFLKAECDADEGRTPIGFEVSFGRVRDDDTGEPLAQADPIVIDLGPGLRFRLAGQIDRIDQIGASSFEIIDYKTGGYFENDWLGTFAGGRRLQHALYGLAAVELLKRKYDSPTIAGGIYYFSSAKGQQERVHIKRPTAASVTEVLSDLRQVIASGTFVHAADESACMWCEFGRACGGKMMAEAAAKQSDPKLAAYRRLVAHD